MKFSTPLSSLNTGLYLLTHMEDRERRARKAQQMEMEIDRINRLIWSLVLLMKAESADTFARVPLDFSDVVRTECLALEMTFRGQPALHTALPTAPVFVFGDAEYLRSAVHEVLHNAYRFTPPEGHISVTLTSTATEAHLEIATRASVWPPPTCRTSLTPSGGWTKRTPRRASDWVCPSPNASSNSTTGSFMRPASSALARASSSCCLPRADRGSTTAENFP